ncbi:MAG: hypothetical protein H6970_00870 [Gammaproteobacteria bacterium]|nr:hypothetical protein [Gammaproteobacteria bacterium]MCP5423609.1 hypothetical protein [Gammaproteobacteria bacterium]
MADEITPIAVYMAGEMNTNAHGPDAKKMLDLNTYSADQCIQNYRNQPLLPKLLGLGITPEECVNRQMTYPQAALLSWTLLVAQGAKWDHKVIIPTKFHPRDPVAQHWHLYDNTLYFYDVWSNLHYGYVGMACGFSESVLLDGAGLEQIGSDIFRGRMPGRTGSPGDGLRAFDDPADRAAITEGIRLYRSTPRNVTAQQLVHFVTTSKEITKKPYKPK